MIGPDVTRSAAIIAVLGGSGTGKSAWVKQQLRRSRADRLLIFDPDGEYTDQAHQVTDRAQLLRLAANARFAIAFKPSDDPAQAYRDFEFVTQTAWEVATVYGRTITLVADELQEVTKPNRAPPSWAKCVRRGRKAGMTVYGIGQRPAEMDKTIYSQPSLLHVGRLNYAPDQRTFAAALNVKPADIATLGDCEYIERDMNTGAPATRGRLTF